MLRKDDQKDRLPMILLDRSVLSPAAFQVSFLFCGDSLRKVHTFQLLARVCPEMCSHYGFVLEDGPAILAKYSNMFSVNMFSVQESAYKREVSDNYDPYLSRLMLAFGLQSCW
jgi:hypothetical protein